MKSFKKFRASIKRLGVWLKYNRTLPRTVLMKKLKQKLVGYYGITDNSKKLDNFRYLVRRLTFKWLNRRSQRRSYNWISFDRMFNDFNIPKAKIYVNIFRLKDAYCVNIRYKSKNYYKETGEIDSIYFINRKTRILCKDYKYPCIM